MDFSGWVKVIEKRMSEWSSVHDTERGYTLIEVLIALVLVGLFSIPLYRLVIAGSRITAVTVKGYSSFNLCQGEAEKLKAMAFKESEYIEESVDIDSVSSVILNDKEWFLRKKVKLAQENNESEDFELNLKVVSIEIFNKEPDDETKPYCKFRFLKK